MAKEIQGLNSDMIKANVRTDQDQAEFAKKHSMQLAQLSNLVENPQDKIIGILQALLGVALKMSGILGGASTYAAYAPAARGPLGGAPSAAPGTGR